MDVEVACRSSVEVRRLGSDSRDSVAIYVIPEMKSMPLPAILLFAAAFSLLALSSRPGSYSGIGCSKKSPASKSRNSVLVN